METELQTKLKEGKASKYYSSKFPAVLIEKCILKFLEKEKGINSFYDKRITSKIYDYSFKNHEEFLHAYEMYTGTGELFIKMKGPIIFHLKCMGQGTEVRISTTGSNKHEDLFKCLDDYVNEKSKNTSPKTIIIGETSEILQKYEGNLQYTLESISKEIIDEYLNSYFIIIDSMLDSKDTEKEMYRDKINYLKGYFDAKKIKYKVEKIK